MNKWCYSKCNSTIQFNKSGFFLSFVADIGTNERNHELPTFFLSLSVAFGFVVFFFLLLLLTLWIVIVLAYGYGYGYVCMVYGIFIFDFQLPTSNIFNSLFCCVALTLYIIHIHCSWSAILMSNTHIYSYSTRNRSGYESALICCVCAQCLLFSVSFTFYISILRSFLFLLRSIYLVHIRKHIAQASRQWISQFAFPRIISYLFISTISYSFWLFASVFCCAFVCFLFLY